MSTTFSANLGCLGRGATVARCASRIRASRSRAAIRKPARSLKKTSAAREATTLFRWDATLSANETRAVGEETALLGCGAGLPADEIPAVGQESTLVFGRPALLTEKTGAAAGESGLLLGKPT